MPLMRTCRTTPQIAHRLIAVLLLMTMALAVSPGTTGNARAQNAESLKVVATFSILGDWVSQVGGDRIELVTIVPAGGDAHTFDPNPDQVASVADANLIFEIGAGFEPWLDDMYAASGSTAKRVAVSDGLDLISAGSHDSKDGRGAFDPHLWGDVRNAIAVVDVIRAQLDAADPGNAITYDAGATTYSAELTGLDTGIRSEVAALPEDRRKLVTSHDTFGYYARAYGFEIVGTALNSLSTESNDPPAREIAALVDEIEASGVPAIFAENVSNSDLMQTIADEAGVTLAPSLYTDALGEPGSDGESYIAMMRYNTATIVTALRES